jgi:CheY-like chemotaxis protein
VAFSQLIRRDERLPDDMHGDAELLVQEADRTRRIVQNLLDFARQRPPERHPTSIATLVDSVLALQSYSLSAGSIDLSLDIPADLPLIDVDRSQLQQVLLNLTLNAIQAVQAERSKGHIWITARRVASRGDGTRLRLSVSDDGPGIAEEARSRLFLPFYTTKAPGEGTGLGLSVSFGIVAAHNGTLRFEPRPGGGATMIVELPVTSREPPERRRLVSAGGARDDSARSNGSPLGAPPIGAAAAAEGAAGVGRASDPGVSVPKVLVLDDEPSIRAFLTKSLRLAAFDPVAVAHGAEAIERCRTESFSAVLVDHRMPGMSGTEVFDAVVAIRPELASRFVFMSGDVLNPELRDFASMHQVTLLAKPFDLDTVNRLVGDVVARSLDIA